MLDTSPSGFPDTICTEATPKGSAPIPPLNRARKPSPCALVETPIPRPSSMTVVGITVRVFLIACTHPSRETLTPRHCGIAAPQSSRTCTAISFRTPSSSRPGARVRRCQSDRARHQMKGMRRYLILDRYSPYPGSLWDRNLSSSRSLRRMTNTRTATLRSAQYEPSANAVPMRKRSRFGTVYGDSRTPRMGTRYSSGTIWRRSRPITTVRPTSRAA